MFKHVNLLILISTMVVGVVHRSQASTEGWLHDAGFYARVERIDGPDYFGNEETFKSAYETLRSRYGNDYLPDKLPKELEPIRDRIHDYIAKKSDRVIYGKDRYEAGEDGINNGEGFGFPAEQLPTKITRLSYCFGISPRILTALIQKESNFVAHAESHTGAVGLMQITAVAGAEVMELLGYPNPYVSHNPKAEEVFEEYINCYLGEGRPWVDPWEVSENTQTDGGHPIISPVCSNALSNCKKGSKKLRQLKGQSNKNFDKWIIGAMDSGSHDYGLVVGAVLLKYHLGHAGVVKGLQNYNGDKVKVEYSKRIRNDADDVNLMTMLFKIFGEKFKIIWDGTKEQLDALEVLKDASEVWQDSQEYDDQVSEDLRRMSIPDGSQWDNGVSI